ncbi:DcaP family trimeric outer membrane transporter [Ferrimonas sediminum]|nr:DcaP family trimeric outer membrane transporter [Ferrimonas sediminum]
MRINNKLKPALFFGLVTSISLPADASYEVQIGEQDTLIFGGYIKADVRYVDGNVAYKDQWTGAGTPLDQSASQFRIFANETRFNTKYIHGDLVGFIEMDFFGDGGNQIISNSTQPRLRHAFIQYQNVLAGQTWTTFMNTSAIGESADFGGSMMGISFVRQGQIRYTNGGLQLALENPESFGGDTANDKLPDVIVKYTFKGDWGNVSIAAVGRQLNTTGGNTETAVGGSIAGRIYTFGKDDLRIQYHQGELGRYVGTAAVKDLVGEQVEDTTAYNVAYRHFWTESLRSTLLYGHIEGDVSGNETSQWGVNLFTNLTPELSVGAEVGNYSIDHEDKDAFYGQFSVRYAL